MLEELRKELKTASEKLARREELVVLLDELEIQLAEVYSRERALYAQLQKEDADVDAMERTTVTSLFYSLLGKREEKLEKEQREAHAARLAYQAVVRELDDCRNRIDAAKAESEDLTRYVARYDALREQIRRELRNNSATAERIISLEQKIAENQSQLDEIDEAILAGQDALGRVHDILSSLSSAESWGTFDLFTKGGIISSMAKHGALDEAQDGAEQLQIALSRFRAELADVRIEADMGQLNMDGFTRFADWFFDGLLVDWTVLSRIHDTQEAVHQVKDQVDAAMARLQEMRSQRLNRRKELENDMDIVVAGI